MMFDAYSGQPKPGRGRKKVFAGKIDVKNLDFSQFKPFIKEDNWTALESLAYFKALKRWAKVSVIHLYKPDKFIKNCKTYISTDSTMSDANLYLYYELVFKLSLRIQNNIWV